MKSWKIVKYKKKGQEEQKEKLEGKSDKKCNRFRCIGILVGIIAVIYAGIATRMFSTIGEKIYGSSAMKPVVNNEYFILIKRLIELFIIRVQVLSIEALVISRMIVSKVCCGISAIIDRVPGTGKIKGSFRNCKYCQSFCEILSKMGAQAKGIACSLHSKIRELTKKE